MSSSAIHAVANGRLSFLIAVLHDILSVFYVFGLFYIGESVKFLPGDHSYYIIMYCITIILLRIREAE